MRLCVIIIVFNVPLLNNLGLVLRDLLDKRGLSQKELSAQIKLSEAALSQIITGKAKPRQINLTRIMKAICETPEEEQMVISAFYNAETVLPDSPEGLERPIAEDNLERVKRYLEMKIASVRLKQQVEAILLQQGVTYFRDYIKDKVICDFYLPDHKTILECRANPSRDWDRTEITCGLIEKQFPEYRVKVLAQTIPSDIDSNLIIEIDDLISLLSVSPTS